MTQEELYVRLLNRYDMMNPSEVDPEFLKEYEITKLFLEKFGTYRSSEVQQRSMNLDAVSSWVKTSRYIYLQYDIPEILELLPVEAKGDIDLQGSSIRTLPTLKKVGGFLGLSNSKIQTLPELMSVEYYLVLCNPIIKSFPKLEYVGGSIHVGDGKICYWIDYFNKTERPHLAEKVIHSDD